MMQNIPHALSSYTPAQHLLIQLHFPVYVFTLNRDDEERSGENRS